MYARLYSAGEEMGQPARPPENHKGVAMLRFRDDPLLDGVQQVWDARIA